MSIGDHDPEFAAFFRENDPRLRGYLHKSLGAPADLVDEVAPFAFMAVCWRWERLRYGHPKAYLFRVGQREVARRRGRYPLNELIDSGDFHLVVDQHDRVECLIDQLLLDKLVQQLPMSQRQAVTLRHIYGFNVAETALIMDVRDGTVKRYTSEGLSALRQLLVGRED
jgi:RNA polymerase sigma factor (sigma-70 family)